MIRFWIEAEPVYYSRYSKGWAYREWFCFEIRDEKDEIVRQTIGLVDDGIRAANRKEYDEFIAMVEPQRKAINEAAKADYLEKHKNENIA